MDFQSQIRNSQINQLIEKVERKGYGKYISRLVLRRIRGFSEQTVTFDFPVTALVGPNGGGKTTILGAAACAYQAVKPRQFFAKSGKLDQSMANWSIEYEIVDRPEHRDSLKQRVSFISSKWDRERLEREVVVFGVARTVPANERADLRRCASNSFSVDRRKVKTLTTAVADAVQKILEKDVSKYTHVAVDTRGRVSLLHGRTRTGVGYSEFHFGAGESSVIRMAMKIETLSDNALILIEEIENGLHPVATVRMVEYLIDVAIRKKTQTIFTTHSNDALLPLPSKAIWAAVNTTVIQGKLDIHSLRALTGQIDAQLVVYVEDEFSKAWVEAALRSDGDISSDLVDVYAMLGDGAAVAINSHHNIDPSVQGLPSMCLIDGDSKQRESEQKRIYRLPGEKPETVVYDQVLDKLDEYAAILAVSLHRRYEDADKVKAVVTHVRSTNRDPHVLFSQVGKELGLIPENIVRSGFLSVWCQAYTKEVKKILAPLLALLPETTVGSTRRGAQLTQSPQLGESARDWLKRISRDEILSKIDAIEAEWKTKGNKSRKDWWDVLGGGKDGRERTIAGRAFPVLEGARERNRVVARRKAKA